MKQLSIRLHLILALALIAIVAILSSGGTGLVLMYSSNQAQQHSAVVQNMVANSTHWSDPAWQQAMRSKLAALNTAVVIRNMAGHVTYQSGAYNAAGPMYKEVVITDGTHQLGTASIYECTPAMLVTLLTLYGGLFALLLTLAGVVWSFTLTVLRPLNAIKKATYQVTRNELDFHFPASRVREVTEAFQSFSLMGEALRTSLFRQAEVEQERRFFISAIAHDLRTPLFSLRGYLQGLSLGLANTPEKVAHYIEVCQTKASALERLIADLFSYTQLEYLEQIPHWESLEIGELVDHVVESLQPQAQTKAITFRVDRAPLPSIIEADAHQLTRVFENLLDNALRYTPVGGSIRIHWYAERKQLHFTVTDMGPGIAAADLPYLFTPLYRGDPSRSRNTGGAGLGLSIAQRILRAHGGDLTAANAMSGGAIFTGSLGTFPELEEVAQMSLQNAHLHV